MKVLKLSLIYFIFILYSLELLLFFFTSDQQKSMVDVKNTRIEIAKKKNVKFDTRTPEEFFFDSKKVNPNLQPSFYYSPIFNNFNTFKEAKKNQSIIPFRGPINSPSISCAEDLNYKIIQNDKYGFKNLNNIYQKKINSMLLGDSYAEGFCVKGSEDIAGNLNKNGFITVNYGVAGTGPLISLAIMREFGDLIKPKNFIYLYFEGNDLEGLNWEKKDKNLIKYLKSDYKMEYLKNYDIIEDFLSLSAKESLELGKSKLKFIKKDSKKNNLQILKAHTIDIIELQNLKNILRYNILNRHQNEYDLNLFFSVIENMNLEAKKFNSNYLFVYVPSWSRYFTQNTKKEASIKLKDTILSELENKKIKFVDLGKYFEKEKNIEQFFPLGYLGHYNASGYSKISEILAKELKQ